MSTQTQLSNPEDAIRVLHVDDEQSPLDFTKSFVELSDSSIHMESVATPEAALRRLEEDNFDCIVSDYQMPGLNGIDLARRIRGFSDIPIIIYTGRGSEEVAEAAFTVGIDDYMRKEINPSHYQVLARRIRSAVEERRAVDALIRSEESYRTLLEQLPDPVTVRIGEKRVYASKHAAEFLGYDDISELLVEGGSEIIPPEDWPIIVDRLERREKGEVLPSMYEVKMRKVDGSTVDVEVHTARIEYQGTSALLNIARDITERKRMEEELRESEVSAREARDYLEKLINHANAPIIVWDPTFKITRFNRAFERLTGYTADEVIDRELSILFPEASREESLSRIDSTLNGVYWESVEIPILRKDGSVRVVLCNSANIYAGEGGAVAATIAQGLDITERKRYEERLKALHKHAAELNKVSIMEEVYEFTLDAMERSLGFSRGAFLVVEGENLMDVMVRGLDEDRPYTLPLDGKGLTVRAMRTGESVLVPDVSLDPDYIDVGVGIKSELVVPVKIYGVAVAVLNTESTELGGYTEYDQVILETLAEHVAFAMKRISDETERARYQDRLEALHRYAPELAQAETLEEIGETTFDAIESVLGFDFGSLSVVEGDLLRHVYIRGFEGGEPFEMPLDGPGVTVRAVMTGETLLISDVRTEEGFVVGFADGVYTSLSELAVPVFIYDAPCGVINVESTSLDAFTEEDRGLLEIFAGHVGSALLKLKQIEELRVSEDKYHTLLESAMDAVVVNNEERYLYANAAAAKLLGLEDPSQLVGRRFVEFFAPEYRELATTRARERLEGVSPSERYSFTMIKDDGSPVDVEANLSVVSFNGESAILAVLRDITERRRLGEELRRSEAEKRVILNAIPEAINLKDPSYHVLWMNEGYTELIGASHEEIQGKRCYTDLFGRDEPHPGCPVKKVLETGEGARSTVTLPDGRVLDVSAEPVLDDSGGVVGVVEAIRDITESKRMEESLRENEERYRAVFENTGTAMVIVEEDRMISLVNKRFAELSGFSREEIEGRKRWMEFIVEEDLEEMTKQHSMRREVPGVARTNYEFRFVDRDRNVKDVFLTVDMIPGTMKSVASLLDITESKRMEEELQEEKEYVRNILDSVLTGIVIIDEETHEIIDANPTALRAIGASREQVIGKVCRNFICQEEEGMCPITDLGHAMDKSERVLLRADGGRIPILKTVTRVTLRGRKQLVESFIEITERTRRED
ncbi:MAG: PAS domain S-box protein [Candidatus Bathyarchaeota archaeon]|nr:PAS domain S-box protein [Candidatus Bathyarchaeota archaeon]